MIRSAIISPCGAYRYSLTRTWDEARRPVAFIGLNPSTADAIDDDPTIRRCIAFAQAWGFGSLLMLNLFAFRATEPSVMLAHPDPVGPDNDLYLMSAAAHIPVIVAAWGVHGVHQQRGDAVRRLVPKMHVLRLTKDGHPGHPLYLPKTLALVEWPYQRSML